MINNFKIEMLKLVELWIPILNDTTRFLSKRKPDLFSRILGLPKVHKSNVPRRPIIDFTNTITYR